MSARQRQFVKLQEKVIKAREQVVEAAIRQFSISIPRGPTVQEAVGDLLRVEEELDVFLKRKPKKSG